MSALTVWIDARCGVAGDMLLGALLDAGADLDVVRRDVEAVLPDTVTLTSRTLTRGVMRATKLDVDSEKDDHPHRAWSRIRTMLEDADLPERVRRDAQATFAVLARAEGHVHGIDPEEVHFHEVGAWDSIADVVGVCSALADLGVEQVLTSDVGLGDGFVRGAHGVVPVPVPAVLRLLEEGPIGVHGVPRPTEGTVGELATPTGVALLVALARPERSLPAGRLRTTGIGAGTKDGLPWANVVRAVLLETTAAPTGSRQSDADVRDLVVLEANVDDLDPRAWPPVIAGLLDVGALDAWLAPIVMKKGRPAHVLSALATAAEVDRVREKMFRATSTFGVRESTVRRLALARVWRNVTADVAGEPRSVRIKVGHRGGEILTATPEYEDCAAVASECGASVADVLAASQSAAHIAGLRPGGRVD